MDEGLLGAGDGRGRMAAGAGCGHLDFGAGNAHVPATNGWICSEPPNFRQRVLCTCGIY